VHLPRISSGDSDPKPLLPPPPPSPLLGLHVQEASSSNEGSPRRDAYAPTRPIRVRPSPARPRSYHDILEDFTLHERGLSIPSSISSAPGTGLGSVKERDEAEEQEQEQEQELQQEQEQEQEQEQRAKDEGEGEGVSLGEGRTGIEIHPRDRSLDDGRLQGGIGPTQSSLADDGVGVVPREDTTRRRKRFSMPAVALQTAPVFARTRQDAEGSSAERRRSAVVQGGERDKGKKERQGEREGSAIGLLMEVLRGKVKYPGGNS